MSATSQPMTDKERMRRYRARRKADLAVWSIELSGEDLNALEASGDLSGDATDPDEVANAVRRCIRRPRSH